MVDLARAKNLTIRQLAQKAGSYAGLAFVGTPATIADAMQEWFLTEGEDGFNIMFSDLPGGLDDVVDKVVPELRRRDLFRREYEGATLRENLGLSRPANRFFQNGPSRSQSEFESHGSSRNSAQPLKIPSCRRSIEDRASRGYILASIVEPV